MVNFARTLIASWIESRICTVCFKEETREYYCEHTTTINKIIYAIKQIGYMRAPKRVVPSRSTIHKYTLTQELKENTDINIIDIQSIFLFFIWIFIMIYFFHKHF